MPLGVFMAWPAGDLAFSVILAADRANASFGPYFASAGTHQQSARDQIAPQLPRAAWYGD
jgi:hypothetical protein